MKELDGLKDSIDRASVRSRVGEKLKEDSQVKNLDFIVMAML